MNDLKEVIDQYLLANRHRWIQTGKELWALPESGFRETETSSYVTNWFHRIGIEHVQEAAVTGKIAKLTGSEHRVNVSLMAEMDAIYCPDHPQADSETGLAHACGHHLQVTALLAVAEALQETGLMKKLDGDITLMAVPAEECISSESLSQLRSNGLVEADCGKKELLRLGLLEDVDMVLASHALVNDAAHPDRVMINTSSNGLTVLRFTFFGKTAHSMVCPEKGVNALDAAVHTINGIQAIRGGFDPREYIRVSYNLTEGGISTGNIPDRAVLEVIFAAKSVTAMETLREQISTAAECGARVLGCTVDTEQDISYLAYGVSEALLELVQKNSAQLTGDVPRRREHNCFSNDLGNISQIIPTAQIVFGGFKGDLHSDQFQITDEDNAYVLPARVLARTLVDLLQDGCEKAAHVVSQFASGYPNKHTL